jgi:hypothetical protein
MTADEAARKREARRTKLKIAAKLRAQLAFQHNLERIDQRIDVIEPAQAEVDKALAEGKTLEITDGA